MATHAQEAPLTAPQATRDRPRLLALRALGLGDLLVGVPAFHALRRAFPGHRLTLAAPEWLSDIVALLPGWELLPTAGLETAIALEPGTVDVAVNLHGKGPESQALISELRANRTIGHRSPADKGSGSDGPVWVEEMNERERWCRLLRWHGIPADASECSLERPSFGAVGANMGASVVHVGAASGSRLWPVERFAAVAGELSARGHRVVITGGESDRGRALTTAALAGLADEAVKAGSLSLGQFAAYVADSRLVVTADTGAAHLASTYGRPSVVLFGPASEDRWGPPPGPHRVLTRADLRRGILFAPDPDPALLAVQVQDVLGALGDLGVL
ncbi:glycosyltransferase family 9 protein [Arthrobacter bambusae]|uniref:glycosyltransferase family 9 protein n=1 Tax=Arthrobacter bambusae TaxID=1338426 RepID=UPI002788E7DA|nr:glycosyltransferase family 9 protein [Arthrobacter bambusae]MDQ0028586.1 ADP-heptose:LPS heptosyltransferase [Arthrobacter bambusae]MDQ0096620.1 ADP-heptose:LPS heptosyltransferase [Arthrobacter bambusae]